MVSPALKVGFSFFATNFSSTYFMRFMAIWVFQKGCNIKHFILIDKEEWVNFAVKYRIMSFKPGDKVRFLHEKGEGKVISVVSYHKIRVELTEGLEIEVSTSELVAI